ncbi:uncharacterized protein LOC141598828 [Silene latifolia]|uniref:uncharacterized protein LOC141598828 n=1 Tax=Silene latifolia TaxID=37657 RepID=UPI003D78248F
MYTARSLTYYRNTPGALSQPPEGPNSGYLVIQDEESTGTHFFGLLKDREVKDLPFPQNKLLTVRHSSGTAEHRHVTHDEVYLIPVINQPLSSNLYYAIKADGKHKGETYANSKEEDVIINCCGIRSIKDAKPRSFDSQDIYQQFQFSTTTSTWRDSTTLLAKSFAPNGHPPHFLRRKAWTISGKTPRNFTLHEVSGLNTSLRAHLPDFNFPISQQCSTPPLVVGTWYCPFMFIIEGSEKERIKNSVFYHMTLEQRWERVFSVDNNDYGHANKVTVDIVVPTEVARIGGQEEALAYMNNDNKVVWFKTRDREVGLSKLIVDRMMWEEERVGWVKVIEDKQVRVVKEEVYEGLVNGWRSFGCYVLVESFVLKRNDGSIVMTYDFMHTHQLKSKWE